MSSKNSLLIYNASAGSGKTFSLVIEFLRLVLDENKNDKYFSSICAMTFTNKAALEMKKRIIEALTDLSNPTDKKQKEYLKFVSNEFKKDEKFIEEKSKKVLHQILHEYEQFNILTIDKFNLRLIRSFARDLELNSNFQTTIDDNDVLSEIIDDLFSEIKNDKNDSFTTNVIEYAKENLDNEEKWDFKSNLKKGAKILVVENNFDLIEKIINIDFSKEKYLELKKQIIETKDKIENEANILLQELNKTNSDFFAGKSKTYNPILNVKNKLFENKENQYFFSENVINNIHKTYENNNISIDFLNCFNNFIEIYQKEINNYYNLEKFREVFYFFSFIKRIAIKLDEFKNKNNNILISEFNKLISNLIKDEEAPYIYEKIGHRFKHFLLDEFQDTSRLQWLNLIPLIHESISQKNTNLIVGDPKQSIYRFKNGLAEQFICLPSIYNPDNEDNISSKSKIFEQSGKRIELKDNFRSSEQIITFNNNFFNIIKDEKKSLLIDFYKEINQNIKKTELNGYVYFYNCLEKNKSKTDLSENIENDNSNNKNKFPFLIDWIKECLEDGFNLGDICILDFTSQKCNNYANYLNDEGYDVVSSDSLLIYKNFEVQLTLSYLRCIAFPYSAIELMIFAEKFLKYKNQFTYENWKKYMNSENDKKAIFNYESFLKDYFEFKENFYPSYTNFYQLLQLFYKQIGLDELKNKYLHQFTDYVFQFEQSKSTNIRLLLEDFEKNKFKISVQISENDNAIKILTAHKSKGLQFPVVFIPSLNWEIMKANKFLFYKEPYFYYTNLTKKNSVWKHNSELYNIEYNKNFIDKINLLYVAFTRPEQRLYICNTESTSNKETLSSFINNIFDKITFEKIDKNLLIIGKRVKNNLQKIQKSESITPKNHFDNLWYPNLSFNDKIKLDEEDLAVEKKIWNSIAFFIIKYYR